MNILALESSCDETAAAVVVDGRRMLSNVVASQVEEHKLYGGVVPEIASRRHAEAVTGVTRQALEEAELTLADIDALAVTHAPGLIGALLVGVNFMKGLAYSSGLPLVPVHHLRSHIAANYLAHPELEPPFLCLVVSGGHTHIVEVRSYTEFRVVGRTRDDAAGEAFDKSARAMGFPYPGGVYIDEAAGRGDPGRYKLPKPRVEGAPYDFSFSGLKTAVINLLHNAGQGGGGRRRFAGRELPEDGLRGADQPPRGRGEGARIPRRRGGRRGFRQQRPARRARGDVPEKRLYALRAAPLPLRGQRRDDRRAGLL